VDEIMNEDLSKFHWEPCPDGQVLLDELIDGFISKSTDSASLQKAMLEKTGTRFFDWIDHLQLPIDASLSSRLEQAGFTHNKDTWEHPGAIFPRIRNGDIERIFLKVESAADFVATHGIQSPIEGMPHGQFRTAHAWDDLWVVERHGYRGFEVSKRDSEKAIRSREILEQLRARQRNFEGNDEAAFVSIHSLLDQSIADLGRDWVCDLFFSAERDYWMRRNRAGRVQKARQDALGLGWANHDHHTYRCRRKTFHLVIGVFEKLGFTCRERFYAGAQAGWGAQIVEHAATGVTIFADVDMSPEEVAGDFAHEGFTEKVGLGTVGLWCELHGESMLEAGMHHLEAQFDFDGLREQMLAESGIDMMKPFTNFEYLRQQFTEGERWAVDETRIQRLLESGDISEQEADSFRRDGAVGSHLENLERNNGFKGFNQTGISDIIARTDARKLAVTE
jgi:hypothetical protein